MDSTTLHSIVHSPEATEFGYALKNMPEDAQRKMYKSLLNHDQKIAVGMWVLDVNLRENGSEPDYCGCLMMDGYLDSGGVDPEMMKHLALTDEDDLLVELYLFYGVDESEIWDWDDEIKYMADTRLRNLSGKFDMFVRSFAQYGMEILGYHGGFVNDSIDRAYGLLTDEGRAVVTAVFQKYVSVMPV